MKIVIRNCDLLLSKYRLIGKIQDIEKYEFFKEHRTTFSSTYEISFTQCLKGNFFVAYYFLPDVIRIN